MTIQTVLNVTQTSLVIDTAGHILGAREPYLYDDATISPANFAILQRHINEGRLRLLTGGITIPPPTGGASFVSVTVSGQNLVFTDSLGNTSTVAIPVGDVDLTAYARTEDVTTALAGKASTTDLSNGLATKVNSSTYTAGIAAVSTTAQTASDTATAALAAAQTGGARPAALTPFTLRLADRATTPINVVAVGSSSVMGTAADPITLRWVDLVGQMLHASYNSTGVPGGAFSLALEKTVSGSNIWNYSGSMTEVVRGLGLLSARLSAGASMTRTFDSATAFSVYSAVGSGIGSFTVSIDGGAATTVANADTGAAANTHTGVWKSPSVSRGTHSITITAVGTTEISGVYVHDGDENIGVRMFNSGRGGAVAADFLSVTTISQRLTSLNPALVFIMYGSNDWRLGTTVATFKSQLQTHIAQLKAAIPGPFTIAVVGQLARTVNQGSGTWDAWITAMKEVVAEDPAQRVFIDAYSMFPASTDSTADPLDLIYTDGVHPTTRGHAVIADAVADALRLPNRNSSRLAVPPPGAPVAPTIAASAGDATVTVTGTGGFYSTLALYGGTSSTVNTSGTVLATSLPYTSTGRTNGTTYYYQAVVTNSAGSASSNTTSATPAAGGGTAPTAAPTATLGTAGSNSQPLTWTSVSGATAYDVEHKLTTDSTWTVDTTSVTGTNYTVTGLTAATSYDYRVRARNSAGPGPYSATVTGNTAAASAVFLSDTFTDTDGKLITAHTSDSGHTWAWHPTVTPTPDTPYIQGNRLAAGANSQSHRILSSVIPPTADWKVECDILFLDAVPTGTTGPVPGLGVRYSATASQGYYVRYVGGVGWRLDKNTGTQTTLGSASTTPTPVVGQANHVVLQAKGTTISVTVDGQQIISVTDTSFTDPGRVVILNGGTDTSTTGSRIDNLTATAV